MSTGDMVTPPVPPTWRAAKSPRSITVNAGRPLPTTPRRPHAPSVHTNRASDGVSASHTISWDSSMARPYPPGPLRTRSLARRYCRPAMKRLLVIGIGCGDPDLLTLQAARLIGTADAFVVLDKGDVTADLVAL